MVFGNFFSAKLYQKAIAEELYSVKKSKKEIQKEKHARDQKDQTMYSSSSRTQAELQMEQPVQVTSLFKSISIPWIAVLIDPLFSIICFPFRRSKVCTCSRRTILMEKVEKRFTNETDLIKILQKIRDTHQILKDQATKH